MSRIGEVCQFCSKNTPGVYLPPHPIPHGTPLDTQFPVVAQEHLPLKTLLQLLAISDVGINHLHLIFLPGTTRVHIARVWDTGGPTALFSGGMLFFPHRTHQVSLLLVTSAGADGAVFDSGATSNMSRSLLSFSSLDPIISPIRVNLASDQSCMMGTHRGPLTISSGTGIWEVLEVLYSPQMTSTILSVGLFCKNSFTPSVDPSGNLV
ncbi:uncharacterized protein VP01_4907g1 [Puccinia sorghi]|uniref:Retrovirus-related Pol polyprotein from transposon TNT 1-94-like beta-barrel domain-containing protein n=1 Tax=Puccinia sorghi TaxID=27349 RepID=A0A0L6UMU9_9BASI|nr:uncharacterized protein VP01_4907g1 [Puccinia sorghi]